jgi:hypothetical protein
MQQLFSFIFTLTKALILLTIKAGRPNQALPPMRRGASISVLFMGFLFCLSVFGRLLTCGSSVGIKVFLEPTLGHLGF